VLTLVLASSRTTFQHFQLCNRWETRNMGQSPTWGRLAPQVRLEIYFRGWL